MIRHHLRPLCLPWTPKGNRCSVLKSFSLHLRSLDSFPDLAAKNSLFNDDELEEETECATQEATIEELIDE